MKTVSYEEVHVPRRRCVVLREDSTLCTASSKKKRRARMGRRFDSRTCPTSTECARVEKRKRKFRQQCASFDAVEQAADAVCRAECSRRHGQRRNADSRVACVSADSSAC